MSHHITKWPGTRPWAWWAFGDAPEKYPPFAPAGGSAAEHFAARERQKTEAVRILLRNDLLSQEEIFLIHAKDAAAEALRTRGPGEVESGEAT